MAFESKMLYYDCLAEFNRQFYKDLLQQEHVIGPQVRLSKLIYEDGEENGAANFFGYILEKNGTKYLLNAKLNGEEINLSKTLPIKPTRTIKVADSKGAVYYHIMEYAVARFPAKRSMSFKQLVDTFTSLKHSNPQHQKLLFFMGITQMYDRANFRVSSPAGTGKDSVVDVIGNLIGGCTTIESPTHAKLEERASICKWLAVNEVVDIGDAQWEIIQQFLLATGAHKPVVTKHSRAYRNIGETIDISNFSISLFYNDIDHYPKADTKYFDFVVKKAVSDRFPAFRIYGSFQEDFNQMKRYSVEKYVEQHIQDYRELISNYVYYKENFLNNMKHYNWDKLMSMPQRWETNVGRLLRIIENYCDSQEEFDSWIICINSAMEDYVEMKKYLKGLEKLQKRFGETKDYMPILKKIPTFKERLLKIDRLIKEEDSINYTKDTKIWQHTEDII